MFNLFRLVSSFTKPFANWRSNLKVGLAANIVVFVINSAWLTVALVRREFTRITIYQGECTSMQSRATVLAIFVNVAGTIALGSANAAAQCLMAPTRAELDAAHRRGKSLQIGVMSLLNLRFIPLSRRIMFGALILGSLPLHIFYNSVFISSTGDINSTSVVVDNRFLDGQPWAERYSDTHVFHNVYNKTTSTWNGSCSPNLSTNIRIDLNSTLQGSTYPNQREDVETATVVKGLQRSAIAQSLTHLDARTCASVYNRQYRQHAWFLFVVDQFQNSSGPIYGVSNECGVAATPDLSYNQYGYYPSFCYPSFCSASMLLQPGGENLQIDWSESSTDFIYPKKTVRVRECLTSQQVATCSIDFIPGFQLVVELGIIIIIVVVIHLLKMPHLVPLITTGDVISEFLSRPCSLPSCRFAHFHEYVASCQACEPHYTACRFRWFTGIRKRLWSTTMIFTCLFWMAGLIVLLTYFAKTGYDTKLIFASGFEVLLTTPVAVIMSEASLTINAFLVNLPQLGLSLVYLFLNNLYTCIFASHEFGSYSGKRKGLRVSDPSRDQRSTYWLSLPYKLSIPHMGSSIALHWLLSQALLQTRYKRLNINGEVNPVQSMNHIAWSLPWLIVLLAVGGVTMFVPVVVGCIKSRKVACVYHHDSLTIARACQARDGIKGEGEKRLMFGVIREANSCGQCQGKTGFSSQVVEMLKAGEKYE